MPPDHRVRTQSAGGMTDSSTGTRLSTILDAWAYAGVASVAFSRPKVSAIRERAVTSGSRDGS